jgi:hypothetical protein
MDLIGPAFFVVLAVTLVAFGVAVFQWLWNTTMPDVFGLKVLRYWQALRLLLIASMLTSGLWVRLGAHS